MFQVESIRWDYGTGLKQEYMNYNEYALHYTQILLDRVSNVGCGAADCVYADRVERFYICEYDDM